MNHIRTSARAIIERDGRLLVVRYRDERGEWFALPGGGQRHGESLDASLVREVAEETGARVRVGRLRFVRECIATSESRSLPPGFHQVELFFACDFISTVSDGGVEPDPMQTGAEWLSPDELRRLCFFPQPLLDALDREEFGYLGVV